MLAKLLGQNPFVSFAEKTKPKKKKVKNQLFGDSQRVINYTAALINGIMEDEIKPFLKDWKFMMMSNYKEKFLVIVLFRIYYKIFKILIGMQNQVESIFSINCCDNFTYDVVPNLNFSLKTKNASQVQCGKSFVKIAQKLSRKVSVGKYV